MEKKSLSCLVGLITVTLTLNAGSLCTAHPVDPDGNTWHETSISWVKDHENNLEKDDKFVALVGKVTKQHDEDTYFFTDGTGTIELDSDIKLPVGENIVVRGKIDQAYLHVGPLEINVDSWRHVAKTGEYLK